MNASMPMPPANPNDRYAVFRDATAQQPSSIFNPQAGMSGMPGMQPMQMPPMPQMMPMQMPQMAPMPQMPPMNMQPGMFPNMQQQPGQQQSYRPGYPNQGWM
jgi:hypothetical protein